MYFPITFWHILSDISAIWFKGQIPICFCLCRMIFCQQGQEFLCYRVFSHLQKSYASLNHIVDIFLFTAEFEILKVIQLASRLSYRRRVLSANIYSLPSSEDYRGLTVTNYHTSSESSSTSAELLCTIPQQHLLGRTVLVALHLLKAFGKVNHSVLPAQVEESWVEYWIFEVFRDRNRN